LSKLAIICQWDGAKMQIDQTSLKSTKPFLLNNSLNTGLFHGKVCLGYRWTQTLFGRCTQHSAATKEVQMASARKRDSLK